MGEGPLGEGGDLEETLDCGLLCLAHDSSVDGLADSEVVDKLGELR